MLLAEVVLRKAFVHLAPPSKDLVCLDFPCGVVFVPREPYSVVVLLALVAEKPLAVAVAAVEDSLSVRVYRTESLLHAKVRIKRRVGQIKSARKSQAVPSGIAAERN